MIMLTSSSHDLFIICSLICVPLNTESSAKAANVTQIKLLNEAYFIAKKQLLAYPIYRNL